MGDGVLFSTDANTQIQNVSAPIQLTAVGAVDKYNANVTVKLDGDIATSKIHELVLSASNTECGAIAGTFDAATGNYTFSKLSGKKVVIRFYNSLF